MAANAGAIRAGQAYIELLLKDEAARQGLGKWEGRFKALGSAAATAGKWIAGMGVAAATAMVGATLQFAKAGDALDEMSARTGTSVEFLSALGHAANLSGLDMAGLETDIKKLQKTAYEAATGSKEAAEGFARLGVSVRGADGQLKGTEALFMETVAALSAIENETEKAALATVLFGRSGTSILPMLTAGKEGLVGMMEEAKRLGLVMSTDTAKAAAEFSDRMDEMWAVVKMATIEAGAAVAPIILEILVSLRDLARVVSDLIQTYRTGGAAASDYARNAGAVLRAGDLQRANAQALLAELGNLASATDLNNTQMERANTIIATLTAMYGNLGLSVDATTGKVLGFGEAQAKILKMQREAAEKELQGVMLGRVEKIRELSKQMNEPTLVEAATGWLPGGTKRIKERVRQTRSEWLALIALQEADQKRLDALRAGDQAALAGGAKPAKPTATELDPKRFDKLGPLQNRLNVLRIQQIEDESAREKALIEEKYRFEIERAKAAGVELFALEQARELELEALRKKRADDDARKLQEIQEEMARKAEEADRQGQAVKEADRRFGSMGTFNAFAVGRMFASGGGPAERTARNTEQLVQIDKDILRETKANRMEFVA